jgi:hypothetical protein
MGAVGIHSMAVDSLKQYRPHESPANDHINDCAGDGGGILRGSSGKTNAVIFSAGQPHRLEVLEAASNAFLNEELALGDLGAYRDGTGLQNRFYTLRGQAGRTSRRGLGS